MRGGGRAKRKERDRQRKGEEREEQERGKRASGIAARFRDYSPAEDHREDYTLAAVWRGSGRISVFANNARCSEAERMSLLLDEEELDE